MSGQGHRLLIGDVASGNRVLQEPGTRPRNREHPPTGPLGIEAGLPPLSWPWIRAPAGALRLLRGFIASTVGQADDEGLHPVSIHPDVPFATPDFRSSYLLSTGSASRPHL